MKIFLGWTINNKSRYLLSNMFTCSTFLSLWQYCNTCMLSVIFLIQLMMYWPFLYSIILYSIPEHVFNVVVEMVNYFVMIFAINQSYKVCVYLNSQDKRSDTRRTVTDSVTRVSIEFLSTSSLVLQRCF